MSVLGHTASKVVSPKMANPWPDGWPKVSDLHQWAAVKWRGAATHEWIPLREVERLHVRELLPEYTVCEHSAFMILLKVSDCDVQCHGHTRFHSTGFSTLADSSAAKIPFKHRLLPGWSFSGNKPGIYISSYASGSLDYHYGSPANHQLAALLILRTDTEGSKIGKSGSNRVIRPSNDNHQIVGAIVFRSSKYPTCDPPIVGETKHPIADMTGIPPAYRNHVLHVFGCDSSGIFRKLPTFLSGISVYVPPTAEEDEEDDGENWITTVPLQLAERSAEVMQTIIQLGDKIRESRDVFFWQKHQDEFSGWGTLPPDQWYCRTKSDRVCIWDSVQGKTVWPPDNLKPRLPAPRSASTAPSYIVTSPGVTEKKIGLPGSITAIPSFKEASCSHLLTDNLHNPISQASSSTDVNPGTGQKMIERSEPLIVRPTDAGEIPQQSEEPICESPLGEAESVDESSASEIEVPGVESDALGFMTPRLRSVVDDRLYSIQRQDVSVFANRMKVAGWNSILCANLWKEALEAQQEIIKIGDPGRIRTLCGEVYVTCKILCQRVKEEKVRKFIALQTKGSDKVVGGNVSCSSSSAQVGSNGPMSLPPGVSLPLQVGTSAALSEEMQPLVDKMWKEFLSAAEYCPVGSTLKKAPQRVQDSMKTIFCKRCNEMTPATAKARTRALTRWKFFCEEVGIDPFPFESTWLAVFLQGLSSQGQTVPATTMAQLKIWAEWLSMSFPSEDSFVLAAASSSSVQVPVKQAMPLSPALLWFWEWCLGDPRDVVVWIAAVWLLLTMGTLRYIHLTRSCITHVQGGGFFGFCYLGKSRSAGKRAPFRWCCPRVTPGGTDLHQVLSSLMSRFDFTSSVENPRGIIPDTMPARAPFDLVRGFGSSAMQLHTFHRLSRQIVLAARPEFDSTTLTSYSARRLLPSVAELWHVPVEMRNKIGSWNKDEVREQGKNRMPDVYSHFKLDSALQVKTTIVTNLARLSGDLRAATDTTSWPELCSRLICDLSGVTVPHTQPGQPSPILKTASGSEESSTSTSSSSEEEPTSKVKTDDITIMPWLQMPSGKVLHVREQGQPLCGHFIADTSCQTGSTMESAAANGTRLCDRCWRKMDVDLRHKWVGDVA